MPKAKTKPKILGPVQRQGEQVLVDLTEAQRQAEGARQSEHALAASHTESRHEDERLQEVLEERRAGRPASVETVRRNAPAQPVEKQIGSITFRYETVRCGKENCSRCPHGPYWYAYWKEGGRTRSRYIGRSLPAPALQSYEEKRRARLEK
jgi:hypothetical protein